MLTSRVERYHGVPTLFVNDRPVSGAAYVTYLPERNDYVAMARAGIHFYSMTIFFGAQTINETSQIHPFAPGIFDRKGRPDFSVADAEAARIVEADPQALIFPRVNVSLPKWWEDENPDELNDTGFGGNRRRPCFASHRWLETVDAGLKALAEHFAASPLADHIVGYQISGGNTEEWFPYDMEGSIGRRSREGWAAERQDGDGEAEFYGYLSRVIADDIAYLAGRMKAYTGGRLMIGSFYGYTFETPRRGAGHAALMRLLQCKDLDFLCSPASYAELRRPGIDHACMTVLDSVMLHGKLYFTEVDERTHLTRPLAECRENACEPGTYRGGVWEGPKDARTARNVLRAAFARQMIHANCFWWFDMWGGWYRDEAIYADFAEETRILRRALEDERRGVRAETAVFIDEASHLRLETDGETAYRFRVPLGSAGAPYAAYEIDDFEAVYRDYRALILIEPVETEKMRRVRARLEAEGRDYLLIGPETVCTPELFRAFMKRCGAWIYDEAGDVIQAGAHWLSVHAASAGERTIRLPEKRRVEPQFGEGEPTETDEITLNMQAFETRLFRLD